MLRRIVTLVLLGAALLVAGGCRLDLDVDVVVDRAGAGTFAVAVGADADLLARVEQAGADPLGDLAEAVRDLDGWRLAEGSDAEGGRTVSVSARFADPEELARLTAEVAGALDAPEVSLLEPLRLELDPDTVRLTGAAGLVPTDHVAELGLLPQDAVRLVSEQDAVGYTLRVTMPGPVISANAAEQEGRTAVWHVEPGERTLVEAVGERPSAPLLAMLVGGLLGGLVVTGGLWLFRRRSG